MGFFSDIGRTLGAVGAVVNPVGLVSNLGTGIMDYFANQQDNASVEAMNRMQLEKSDIWNAENLKLARDNMAMQREFAQNGIRWRVEDAQAAGLHPLAALGMNPANASPAQAMFNTPQLGGSSRSGLHAFSNMGQNIMRSVMATMDRQERLMAMQAESAHRQLQNEVLENQKKLSDIELAKQMGNPGMPGMEGQDPPPATSLVRTGERWMSVEPSAAYNERSGSNLPNTIGWWFSNKLLPKAGMNVNRWFINGDEVAGPKGSTAGNWFWLPIVGRYYWVSDDEMHTFPFRQ